SCVCLSFLSYHDYCAFFIFFFSSRRRHTRFSRDWSSDVCSSDLAGARSPLPQSPPPRGRAREGRRALPRGAPAAPRPARGLVPRDRKSTRLNSSHVKISYAVFCLKKKKKKKHYQYTHTRTRTSG